MNSTLYTFFGRSASRRAFRYIFARLISVSLTQNINSALRQAQRPRSRSQNTFPFPLAKDAAPIPNAKSNQKLKLLAFEPLVLEKSSKALVLSSWFKKKSCLSFKAALISWPLAISLWSLAINYTVQRLLLNLEQECLL